MASITTLIKGDRARLETGVKVLFVLCPVTKHIKGRQRDYLKDAEGFADLCAGLGVDFDIMAVNLAVEQWPGVLNHAASLEGRRLPGWITPAR